MGLGPSERRYAIKAEQIVIAAHIRGYLQKLEAQRIKSEKAREVAEIRQAESVLEQSVIEAQGLAAEYETLTAAMARQKQLRDDEMACRRADEIKRHCMPVLVSGVREAANKLGRPIPEMPLIE